MIQENFLTLSDAHAWNEHLPPGRSVFGSLGYARVCQAFRGCSPRLYVARSGSGTICYPILLRSLSDLAFASGAEGKWDTTTPDFTGPMVFGAEPSLAEAFPTLRDRVFREEGVLAEFAHLHPWGQAANLLAEGTTFNREIVWVDTTLDGDELWTTHFQHACRKNINTALKNGVRVFESSTDAHLREFHRIYIDTMRRNSASSSYFFPLEFFVRLRDELGGHCRFALAEYRDSIVAATLYLYDDDDVFSYLGGADAEFQHVRPTNLVIWETLRWARGAGKKRLILGGGHKPDDGIFRFKCTFSRHRKAFHVFKRIHDESEYKHLDWLCRKHNAMNGDLIEYFPSYRYVKPMQAAPALAAASTGATE